MSYFEVTLANKPALAPYSDSAIVSVIGNGAMIHLQNEDCQTRGIQKAARKIASLGVANIKFAGEWDENAQWSFVSSFCGVDHKGQFSWAKSSNESKLNNQLKALLFAKNIINQTPQDISPEKLAQQSYDWIKSLDSEYVSARFVVGEDLKEEGWQGIYEVGRGSIRPPVLLELDYHPTGKEADVDVALVGKGITFDSGGYSIKSSEGMLDMKCDMGGAATVTAALGLAIMQGLKKRVKLYLCCAENLISGHAYKLGDIITYKNGTTVEIVNTDAEGRLVLADGLMAAAADRPKLTIDAATLTGAAMMAVGKEYNAVFGIDDSAVEFLLNKAKQTNELHWRLPLEKWHAKQCPSPFADTANSRPAKGGGAGGASNAAGFLLRFAGNDGAAWVHVDLAAAYNRSGSDIHPNGATAQGVLTIAACLLD
ncbi:aminopeptidase PepB [Glaciecola sp. KUL10]|uniref:aminopeptidase PepB n=1 Tax=Glaciecola sp. (strain KUL10) TaxID=2161813 RepID=UPI000D786667|nr:aminopeptidase PepB [Glaciecola sp. KUL10]GBL03821.1 aminopeptidase [Glaciecola sp. KUL10]